MNSILVVDKTPSGEVVVTNINIPFWSMVTFMIKLSVASIPAAIILIWLSAAYLESPFAAVVTFGIVLGFNAAIPMGLIFLLLAKASYWVSLAGLVAAGA